MAQKIIKFYATWCGPCKIYGKAFNKVKEEFKENSEYEFIEIDVDKDTTGMAAKYKVNNIPHTVRIKENGNVLERGGRLSVDELKSFIKE